MNSRQDEDLDVFNPSVFNVPSLKTDNPFTIDNNNAFDDNNPNLNKQDVLFMSNSMNFSLTNAKSGTLSAVGILQNTSATIDVLEFSGRALLGPNRTVFDSGTLIIDLQTTMERLLETIHDPRINADGTFLSSISAKFHGFNLVNIDLRGINVTALAGKTVNVYLLNASSGTEILTGKAADNDLALNTGVTAISLVNSTLSKSLSNLNDTSTLAKADQNKDFKLLSTSQLFNVSKTDRIGFLFNFTEVVANNGLAKKPVVADFFSFGFLNEGIKDNERISNSITRLELEETGDNTSTFAGTAEFRIANQVSILDPRTYEVTTIDREP